ncbi:SMC-Scp complex subunit ScpB [Methylomonas methanica]|uniref:Chromosome segregation and condensation protein, ScpB n=1 Tax=Methylomonas methanica (strain DSM 25384 / MC09) TaxID=857087 RepID=G0A6V6_METMM|nr:chromosome segregation and condensation protein, ScpB [Methylomonas methanica MC09]
MAAPAIEEIRAEVAVESENVVPEVKPKPRKPRTKPAPAIATVQARKTKVRFPEMWTVELQGRAYLPKRAPLRKPVVRLPANWADKLRANLGTPLIAEYQPPLSEPSIEFDVNTKRIVEAILFAANKPMTIKQIQETFPELEQPDTLEIQTALEAIAQDYLSRPIGLKKLASGYRFQVREGVAPWVTRLFEEKPPRYSRALLETLSIIAYRQPVTRGEIEDIRGVGVSSSIIHTLLEREWIRVIAHKEVPGRPALYGTTKQFLDYFNLTSLNELPTLEEITHLDFSNDTAQQEPRERSQTDPAETEISPQIAEQEAESGPQAIEAGNSESRTLH